MTFDAWLSRFPLFLMVFSRCSGLLATAPVFASRYIPPQIRAMLAMFMAAFCVPLVPSFPTFRSIGELVFCCVTEALIGLATGYSASAVFSALQVAGQILDMELGFGMVNVLDPQYGTPVPLLGNLYYLMALLLVVSFGGDRIFLRGLVGSLTAVPPGSALRPIDPGFGISLMRGVLINALRIAAPVLGVMFLVTVALGVIARAVPQMNIFIVGMPAKVGVGLMVLAATLPLYAGLVENLVLEMQRVVDTLIRAMG